MSIVEYVPRGRHLNWSIDARETGESTKYSWVEVVGLIAYPPAFSSLPSFARLKRPRRGHLELNYRHLRSYGKIVDRELSIVYQDKKTTKEQGWLRKEKIASDCSLRS